MTPTRPQAVRRQTAPPRCARPGRVRDPSPHEPVPTRTLPTRTLKNKNGRADPCRSPEQTWRYLLRLTAFFSSAPAENFATLRAAILIVAPVCGLRPLRAFLCETEKVPKPISATRSPFFSAEVMLSTVVSMAPAACVLLMWQPAAILSMRSALFILAPVGFPYPKSWGNEQFCCVEARRSYLATGLSECQL